MLKTNFLDLVAFPGEKLIDDIINRLPALLILLLIVFLTASSILLIIYVIKKKKGSPKDQQNPWDQNQV